MNWQIIINYSYVCSISAQAAPNFTDTSTSCANTSTYVRTDNRIGAVHNIIIVVVCDIQNPWKLLL